MEGAAEGREKGLIPADEGEPACIMAETVI